MKNLTYKIGALEINLPKFTGGKYWSNHKFIVGAIDSTVSIYIAQEKSHPEVVSRFRTRKTSIIPVGGGNCYLDNKERLVLDSYSGIYGAIPKIVAITFGELMIPELIQQGVEVNGVTARPYGTLNPFWQERGFTLR